MHVHYICIVITPDYSIEVTLDKLMADDAGNNLTVTNFMAIIIMYVVFYNSIEL